MTADKASAIYEQVVASLTPLADRAAAREDVQCKKGCSACCQDGLSVSAIEAARIRGALSKLDPARRARLRLVGEGSGQCVFLVDDACAIYAARPMVCRTQGLPLVYAADTVPAERLSAQTSDGRGVTWCPLNYTDAPPSAPEIVDADQIDETIATLNQAFLGPESDPARRYALRDLATE